MASEEAAATNAQLYERAVAKALTTLENALTAENLYEPAQMMINTLSMGAVLSQLQRLVLPHIHLVEDLDVKGITEVVLDSIGDTSLALRILDHLSPEQLLCLAKLLRFFFHLANKLQE